MTHKIFKKALLFALTMLFIELASAQTVEPARPKSPKANSEIKNIEFEIAEAFKTVAIEIKNIDFEKIGKTVAVATREIRKELEGIQIIISDNQVPEYPEEPVELTGTAEKTKNIRQKTAQPIRPSAARPSWTINTPFLAASFPVWMWWTKSLPSKLNRATAQLQM